MVLALETLGSPFCALCVGHTVEWVWVVWAHCSWDYL